MVFDPVSWLVNPEEFLLLFRNNRCFAPRWQATEGLAVLAFDIFLNLKLSRKPPDSGMRVIVHILHTMDMDMDMELLPFDTSE